jgi:hypothetical protein
MRINNKNSANDEANRRSISNDMQFFFQFYLSPHLTVPFIGWVKERKNAVVNEASPVNPCHQSINAIVEIRQRNFVNALALMTPTAGDFSFRFCVACNPSKSFGNSHEIVNHKSDIVNVSRAVIN